MWHACNAWPLGLVLSRQRAALPAQIVAQGLEPARPMLDDNTKDALRLLLNPEGSYVQASTHEVMVALSA